MGRAFATFLSRGPRVFGGVREAIFEAVKLEAYSIVELERAARGARSK